MKLAGVVGRTEDGRAVISGAILWQYHATYGFPLEFSIPLVWDQGQRPDWVGIVETAVAEGTNRARLVGRLDQIIGELGLPASERDHCRRLLHQHCGHPAP